MPSDSESDWEYEYSDSATETFYIPLDLSNIPSTTAPSNTRRTGHPTLLKSRLRALNAQRSLQDAGGGSTGGRDAGVGVSQDVNVDGDAVPATAGEAQIVGLHTENPLVMYNGHLLSCTWTSTIGTDLFFTTPTPTSTSTLDPGSNSTPTATADGALDGLESEPLRKLPGVQLLGLGTAKLVARVGRLRPRDEVFQPTIPATQDEAVAPVPQTQTQASASDTNANQESAEMADPAPHSFLAKLNQLRAKKGEASLALSTSGEGLRLVSGAASEQLSGEGGEEDVEMDGT